MDKRGVGFMVWPDLIAGINKQYNPRSRLSSTRQSASYVVWNATLRTLLHYI